MKFKTLFVAIAFLFTTSLVLAAGQAPAMEHGCCAAAAAHAVAQDHSHGETAPGCCGEGHGEKAGGCAMCAKTDDAMCASCAKGDKAAGACCGKTGDTAKAGCCDKTAAGDAKGCCDKPAPKR